MSCPYLQYRRSDGDGLEFDHERAFCEIEESFVSPMKADICNSRGRFHHTTHCEVSRQYEASVNASEREPQPMTNRETENVQRG